MNDFLKRVRKLAYHEIEKTGMPVRFQVDLSCEIGKKLAKKLKADINIVEAGTLLMDCLIGQALQKGKIKQHIQMSLAKTDELLKESFLSEKDKENVRHCVSEHHGAKDFYSLESEICCNADCYRFASIKGFSYALRFLRDMPFEELVKLLKNKLDEKANGLTLKICKTELNDQIRLINEFLKYLR